MFVVSVIIPTYNRLDLVQNAIHSVVLQTYQNYEIIIIDDGSEKPISFLENEYDKLRVIRHNSNLGEAAARNTGIHASTGKYIAFLDSDDEWLPEKLAIQVSYLEQNHELGLCTTGYIYETEEGTSIEIPKPQKNWHNFLARGLGLAPGSTLMGHRELMSKFSYDVNFTRMMDWDWFLKFTTEYSMDVIQKPLSIIHRGEKPNAEIVEKSNLLILKKHASYFDSLGLFYGKQCIAKRYLEIATHYFREKKFSHGWLYLWRTIKTNPFQRPSMYVRIFDYLFGTNILIGFKNTINKIQKRKIDSTILVDKTSYKT